MRECCGTVCEKCLDLTDNVVSCTCAVICRPGTFCFASNDLGPCWPEVIPRCRSPPPLFRLPVNPNTRNGGIYESYQSAGYLPPLYMWRRLFFCPEKLQMIQLRSTWTWMSWILPLPSQKPPIRKSRIMC